MTMASLLRDPNSGMIYVRLYDSRDTATSGDYPYRDVAMERVAWDPDIMRQLVAESITRVGFAIPESISVPPRYVLKSWTRGAINNYRVVPKEVQENENPNDDS